MEKEIWFEYRKAVYNKKKKKKSKLSPDFKTEHQHPYQENSSKENLKKQGGERDYLNK